METSIDWVDLTVAVVSTDEGKWIRRIRSYKERFPDLVRIKTEPEGNDGNMVAEVPTNWVKIAPTKGLTMSDEQRAVLAERLRKQRETAHSVQDGEEDEE